MSKTGFKPQEYNPNGYENGYGATASVDMLPDTAPMRSAYEQMTGMSYTPETSALASEEMASNIEQQPLQEYVVPQQQHAVPILPSPVEPQQNVPEEKRALNLGWLRGNTGKDAGHDQSPAQYQTQPKNKRQAKRKENVDFSFQSLSKYLRLTYILLFVLIFCIGGWAAISKINGAVITQGTIIVEGKPKTIQHLDGGILKTIHVRDGQLVEEGEVLLELDPTILDATQTSAQTNYHENQALIARLIAQQRGTARISWPDGLEKQKHIPSVSLAIAGQRNIFNAQRAALRGQIRQLEQRISQFSDQNIGTQARLTHLQTEIELVEQELPRMRALLRQKLIERSRVIVLDRDNVRLKSEFASLRSQEEDIRHSIQDLRIEIAQLHRAHAENVLIELREAQTQAVTFQEQLKTAENKQGLVLIKAPTTGRIHNMAITTLGGVVAPGQEILQIIPSNARLIIEARVQPQDVDQVAIGQEATIRFSGLNQKQTPELTGSVIFVSPNSLIDQASGFTYFNAKLEISEEELAQIKNVELVPGMMAEAFIKTEERTVLNYLLKPAKDAFSHSLREP